MSVNNFIFSIALLLCCVTAQSQTPTTGETTPPPPKTNVFAIGLDLGLKGLGFDLAYKFTPKFGARVGYNFFKSTFKDQEFAVPGSGKTAKSSGTYDISSLDLMLDFALAPMFRIQAGANISTNKDALDVLIQPTDNRVTFLEYEFTVPPGAADAQVLIEEGSTVHPYLGIGLGRLVPRKRVGLSLDLGLFQYKKPQVISVESDAPVVDKAELQKKLDAAFGGIYPVLNLRLAVRLI